MKICIFLIFLIYFFLNVKVMYSSCFPTDTIDHSIYDVAKKALSLISNNRMQ